MKTILFTIICVIALLWVGDLTITFKPFSISLPGWHKALGIILFVFAMAVYNIGEYERNDINFPFLRIFNGVTGRYELLIDDVSIDAYGRVRDSSGCVVEWFTGVFDMNGIPLFENDIIMPVKDGISQYRRIWRTVGGFILSRSNDVKGLSKLDMLGADYLVNERVQQYISDGCVKVGSATIDLNLLKEEIIRNLSRRVNL